MRTADGDSPEALRAEITRLQSALIEALNARDLAEHDREQFEDSWNHQREQIIRLRARLAAIEQEAP